MYDGTGGNVFVELLPDGLKKEQFCIIDHDAKCTNALLETFLEAKVIHSGNRTYISHSKNCEMNFCLSLSRSY